jgi:hypothetical protein
MIDNNQTIKHYTDIDPTVINGPPVNKFKMDHEISEK